MCDEGRLSSCSKDPSSGFKAGRAGKKIGWVDWTGILMPIGSRLRNARSQNAGTIASPYFS